MFTNCRRVANVSVFVYTLIMTTIMKLPTTTNALDNAIMNINMIISVRHLAKKDIAGAIGKMPQSFSRMLKPGYQWSFEDMCKVADYLGLSLNDLVNPALSPSQVTRYEKTVNTNRSIDGNQVAGQGFEPWTSGL